MKNNKIQLTAVIMLIILSLTACNFGETPSPSAKDYTVVTNAEARSLSADFTNRLAISYSGYRTGQSSASGVFPSYQNIVDDLNILNAMGFTLLRLYDTSEQASLVLQAIKAENLDMKVMLGVWISGPKETDNNANTTACNKAVEWAAGIYKDQIAAISVGNETMVDWSFIATPAADIAYYVSYVREKITQPVTVDDNWEPWSLKNENGPSAYADVFMVAEAVDFIALHTYAIFDAEYDLWDFKQLDVVNETQRAEAMMSAAVEYAKSNYNAVKTALTGIGIEKPILIGETGWKSKGDAMGIAHPVNQQIYYEKLSDWVYNQVNSPVACFFFEAFDEPWKGGDDNWGFFNVDREAKYIVYSETTWDSTSIWTVDEDPVDFTPTDAVYFKAPLDPIDVSATDSTFYIFADNTSAGYNGQLWDQNGDGTAEAENFQWEAWENNSSAGTALDNLTANSQDTETGIAADTVAVITPAPLSWGWGMMGLIKSQGFDLSGFASGNLQFCIKTSYSGILEIGIQTGSGVDNDSMDLLVQITPDSNTYGYAADGAWHDVTIPIADLVSAAKFSYGNDNPGVVKLEKVFVPFVIGDRIGPFDTSEIWVDQIRWTK